MEGLSKNLQSNKFGGGSGPEQGFLPELVIKKGKTIPEYDGGNRKRGQTKPQSPSFLSA